MNVFHQICISYGMTRFWFLQFTLNHTMTSSIRNIFRRGYWPFVRGKPLSPVNSPNKAQWRGTLMFSLISAWINGWVHSGQAGDLRLQVNNIFASIIAEASTSVALSTETCLYIRVHKLQYEAVTVRLNGCWGEVEANELLSGVIKHITSK